MDFAIRQERREWFGGGSGFGSGNVAARGDRAVCAFESGIMRAAQIPATWRGERGDRQPVGGDQFRRAEFLGCVAGLCGV